MGMEMSIIPFLCSLGERMSGGRLDSSSKGGHARLSIGTATVRPSCAQARVVCMEN